MLKSIEICSFRGLRSLSLSGLQPVNLIVGKNNSGKTSLLEAIAVLLNPIVAVQHFQDLRSLEKGLSHNFKGHSYSKWVINNGSPDGRSRLSGSWEDAQIEVCLGKINPDNEVVGMIDSKTSQQLPKQAFQRLNGDIKSCVVGTVHKSPEALVKLFGDAVRRRDGEEMIESQLRSVDRRIKKVRVDPHSKGNRIVVDTGLNEAVPLSQLGQGIHRLVEIFSEIIGSEADVCFIDEVENGIHHTHLEDLWEGIRLASTNFHVQVFATTHSDECLEAAHAVFRKVDPYAFATIQLFREAGEVQGRVLDRDHIAAGIDANIELRG